MSGSDNKKTCTTKPYSESTLFVLPGTLNFEYTLKLDGMKKKIYIEIYLPCDIGQVSQVPRINPYSQGSITQVMEGHGYSSKVQDTTPAKSQFDLI